MVAPKEFDSSLIDSQGAAAATGIKPILVIVIIIIFYLHDPKLHTSCITDDSLLG